MIDTELISVISFWVLTSSLMAMFYLTGKIVHIENLLYDILKQNEARLKSEADTLPGTDRRLRDLKTPVS